MKAAYAPTRLDVKALAQAGDHLEGETPLQECERLLAEMIPSPETAPFIHWRAQGEWRERLGGAGQCWLHVTAQVRLPLVCQRCMGAVEMLLAVDRSFRFVADEATAAREDEESEEDLLVLSPDFDLMGLIEDELLMALPLVPMHEACLSEHAPTSEDDAAAVLAEKPNPFAVLATLKTRKQ